MQRNAPIVLVTGGPTRAYLDRVRFLTNVSTGGVAFEICREMKRRGFRVIAVIGPSSFNFEKLKLQALERVETTDEMHRAVMRALRQYKPGWAVLSAAVLDFEPTHQKRLKVPSSVRRWNVKLKPTAKIIDAVGIKFPGVARIGFKLEAKKRTSAQAIRFAKRYLLQKNLGALCYNQSNHISQSRHPALLVTQTGRVQRLHTKREIAKAIASHIELRVPS